jgi:hypothetical protein
MRKLRKPAAALLLAAVLVCSVAMTTASVRASGEAAQGNNSAFCDHLQSAIDWLAAHPSPAHDWLRHILEQIYQQYC